MKVIQMHDHKPGCTGVEQVENGSWRNPWYATGRTVWRDKNGRKNGATTAWLVFGCNSAVNDPCPAEVLVDHEDVCDAISDGLRQAVDEAGPR